MSKSIYQMLYGHLDESVRMAKIEQSYETLEKVCQHLSLGHDWLEEVDEDFFPNELTQALDYIGEAITILRKLF